MTCRKNVRVSVGFQDLPDPDHEDLIVSLKSDLGRRHSNDHTDDYTALVVRDHPTGPLPHRLRCMPVRLGMRMRAQSLS